MKFTLLAFVVGATSMIFGQNKAWEYMTKIDENYTEISSRMWDYTSTVAHSRSGKKIDAKRQELISSVRQAKINVSRLGDYEGSTAYRDSVLSYLKLQEIVLTENYEKILNMEEIAEQSYDLMEAYLLAQSEAGKMMDAASDMLQAEQKKFGDANNITITENDSKIGKKLQKAGEVYDYYNPIYLIFFKSYKQEAYMNVAIAENDINGIEQARKSLITTSEEGLQLLADIKDFNGDNNLKEACLEILKFYKNEGEKDGKVISDFYLKKETYEKIQAAFENIKKKDRTQEDVNKVNKAGEEYNKAVNEYNEIVKVTNKERSKNIDNWNNAVTKFLKTHISR
ncbi:MAG: hypothetical protein R2799_10980 [Crocinitomicaceae bacterium]